MLLVVVAGSLTSAIFVVNLALHRPLLEALLFSLAIAVGITPQLLPAVVSTSLAAGSRRMSRRRVLVKRLVCIEDLGDVDLLFTDVLMPGGMDGLALAREARRRRPGLPVLLTTGYTGAGAADVPRGMPMLRKPYKLPDFAEALRSALAGPPPDRALAAD